MKKDMVFLFIVLGGFFVSCTSGFREFNTDLAGITDEDLKVDADIRLDPTARADTANQVAITRIIICKMVGTVRCGDIRMLMFSLRSTSRNNLPVPGNRLFSV